MKYETEAELEIRSRSVQRKGSHHHTAIHKSLPVLRQFCLTKYLGQFTIALFMAPNYHITNAECQKHNWPCLGKPSPGKLVSFPDWVQYKENGRRSWVNRIKLSHVRIIFILISRGFFFFFTGLSLSSWNLLFIQCIIYIFWEISFPLDRVININPSWISNDHLFELIWCDEDGLDLGSPTGQPRFGIGF